MNPSIPAIAPVDVPTPDDIVDQATRANPTGLRLIDIPHNRQLALPIHFSAHRGSDRIRARLYHDSRLTSAQLLVALALSEFADRRGKAWPKQALLAKMTRLRRQRVNVELKAIENLGILTRYRTRSACVYVFSEAWLMWFHDDPPLTRTSDEAPDQTTIPLPFDQGDSVEARVLTRLDQGESIRATAKAEGLPASTVQSMKARHPEPKGVRRDVRQGGHLVHPEGVRRDVRTGGHLDVRGGGQPKNRTGNRRTYGARPGPQAGGGAVPRTHAEAPAERAAALDGDALIERDLQRSEAGHQAKVAAGKVKSVLVMESSEGGEIDETATPPSAAEKSTTVAGGKTETSPSATPQTADEKSSTADEGYTDEQYRADARAFYAQMTEATRARGVFRCACGCPDPGTVCPQCGAGNSGCRPSADTTAGGDA